MSPVYVRFFSHVFSLLPLRCPRRFLAGFLLLLLRRLFGFLRVAFGFLLDSVVGEIRGVLVFKLWF